MGRYGQAILTIVGTVVGAYFGYPALGAALGSLAGQLLFPTQLPTVNGPRLSDIAQTAASVGGPIPRGWGTFPAVGCIIWQGDLVEVIQHDNVGGKGGGGQDVNTPTYYQSFAIGLNDGEIAGVRRIWANGKLIYDKTPQRDDEALSSFQNRMAANSLLDQQMAVYLGTETQDVDPTIEAALGVGNASAFRGLAYVVFDSWNNKPEDGNRMPATWKFECYQVGEEVSPDTYEYANEILYPWNVDSMAVYNAANVNTFQVYAARNTTSYSDGSGDGPFDTVEEALTSWVQYFNGTIFPAYWGGGPASLSTEGLTQVGTYDDNTQKFWPLEGGVPGERVGAFMVYTNVRVKNYGHTVHTADDFVAHLIANGNDENGADCYKISTVGPGGAWFYGKANQGTPFNGTVWVGENSNIEFGGKEAYAAWAIHLKVTRSPAPPPDPCSTLDAVPIPGVTSYCIYNGTITNAGAWEKHAATYKVMQAYTISGDSVSKYPLGPARPSGHLEYSDSAFWTAAYDELVSQGYMPSGLTYGIDYPVAQSYAYRRQLTTSTVDTVPVLVSDIVRDICVETGFDPDDIDTTDIDDKTVIGYVRTNVMTARAALGPLRSARFFDIIESSPTKLKCVARGKAIVASLEDEDLGAFESNSDVPSKLTTKEAPPTELPKAVRIHYLSFSRDYEPGQQDSPYRVDSGAVNVVDSELPVVLTDDDAAQIAEVVWSDAWRSRYTHEVSVDAKWHPLEPTDAIEVPVDNRSERMRIVDITDTFPSIRKLSLQRDDDGSYVSHATGSSPPVVTQTLNSVGPATVYLLDLPMLRSSDDEAGFYVAVEPAIYGARFNGAVLYRSLDGGSNYSAIAQISGAATIGRVDSALGEGASTIIDNENELRVTLHSGSLSSTTEQAMLSGANAAVIGAHGRWEVIQWQTATSLGGLSWSLTGLLRGRRGTEHAIGSSVTGDIFVMLSPSTVNRVSMDSARIGQLNKYKCVASGGDTLTNAVAQDFAGAGEALKPFSPVDIAGTRDGSGNLTITWIRRARFGQELQSGVDVPLGEESESYEIEVYNGLTVVRTISSSSATASYSAADQTSDFGSTQDSISIKVYQMSATVGRGHAGEATV